MRTPIKNVKRAGLCYQHKPTLDPQPSQERMKIMATHTSATAREPHVNQTTATNTGELDTSEEKIEALAELICQAGNESAAALLVLMAKLQNAADPNALANAVKHLAFTRCGELNVFGMVDAQISVLEGELLPPGLSL